MTAHQTARILNVIDSNETLRSRFRSAAVPALVAYVALLSACGSSGDGGTSTVSGPPKPVSVALDWTPNTNHIGAYVAQKLGWYRDAGLDVRFIPYASTQPELLVGKHKADFGFSYQAGIAYARASGQDVRQVMANIAKPQYAIGVRASDSRIKSPKDLDGKTYAGFGTPDEKPELSWVIRKAGGTGDFKTVTLNTSAYDAVYSRSADFTIPVKTWEGVEARLAGKPFRFFDFADYGFPRQYSSAIVASDSYLKANSQTARRFLSVTRRGYEFARENPQKAAELLIAANPQTLKNPELVRQSAKELSDGGFYTGKSGEVGPVEKSVWENYGRFLYGSGLLTGPNGKPLSAEPNWSDYFTNEYLPKS